VGSQEDLRLAGQSTALAARLGAQAVRKIIAMMDSSQLPLLLQDLGLILIVRLLLKTLNQGDVLLLVLGVQSLHELLLLGLQFMELGGQLLIFCGRRDYVYCINASIYNNICMWFLGILCGISRGPRGLTH